MCLMSINDSHMSINVSYEHNVLSTLVYSMSINVSLDIKYVSYEH